MKVLLVNHTAMISGAEYSLLTLLPQLRAAGVEPVVACPRGGLAERVEALGVTVLPIPECTASWRLDPLRTPLNAMTMARTAVILRGLGRRSGAACVHANSVRASVMAVAARAMGGPPTVAHVRDELPEGRLSRVVARLVARSDVVLAVSEHVARPLEPHVRGNLRIGHPSIDLAGLNPAEHDRAEPRRELGIADDETLLTIVGQITPWKGQDDAIRILARVRDAGRRARLLVVGAPVFVHRDVGFDNRTFDAGLRTLASQLGVRDAVHFLGRSDDIGRWLSATDIALVPSWEEPFGRVVVEAMAMGVCVIATARGGPREIITDGRDGRLVEPRDPRRWANVVLELIDDPETRAALAARAQLHAQRYAATATVTAVVDAYRTVAVARHEHHDAHGAVHAQPLQRRAHRQPKVTELGQYYRDSRDYRAMLAEQDEAVHAPYVKLFRRWAPAGARVLDVGCGVGTSTRLLCDAGFDAAGTDFAAQFLPDADGFFAADFTRPSPVPPGSFAAIGASNVLEHVADPRAFLTELVRAAAPGGTVILVSPNLTSPLVGMRILDDLRRGRTPYLGVRRRRDGLALLAHNMLRSTGAAAGRSAFEAREHRLDSGIVGYDVDAVYWTNAAEVRRHLEGLGCTIVQFQGAGRTAASRLIARRLPSFAGRLLVVARTAV